MKPITEMLEIVSVGGMYILFFIMAPKKKSVCAGSGNLETCLRT